jgi:hypothetical protein
LRNLFGFTDKLKVSRGGAKEMEPGAGQWGAVGRKLDKSARCHTVEDHNLNNYGRETLKSYIILLPILNPLSNQYILRS